MKLVWKSLLLVPCLGFFSPALAQQFVQAHPNNFSNGRGGAGVEQIVLHTIEGSAQSGVNTFLDPSSQRSAHYIVDFDGSVIQMVRDRDRAFHVRGQNRTTIGIEHAGFAGRSQWDLAQLRGSAALVRRLCDQYGIPKDRTGIVSHAELDSRRRSDPGAAFPWDEYLRMVNGGAGDDIVARADRPAETAHEGWWGGDRGGSGASRPSSSGDRGQASSRQPQASSRQPQASSRQPQASSQQPQASSRQPQASSQQPQATDRQPQTTGKQKQPQASDPQPQTTGQQAQDSRDSASGLGESATASSGGYQPVAGGQSSGQAAVVEPPVITTNADGLPVAPNLTTDQMERVGELMLARAKLMSAGPTKDMLDILGELTRFGAVPFLHEGGWPLYASAIMQGSDVSNGRSFTHEGASYTWGVSRDMWPVPVPASPKAKAKAKAS